MFTGIVEEQGTIEKITHVKHTLRLTISALKVMDDIALGDSIAINGVCLTVTDFTRQTFTMDVMPETFNATSLSTLKQRSLVNLERAMHASGRFGGHFVTGHVDGTGQILAKTTTENALVIQISVPTNVSRFLLDKGSIAVDGVSLTVFGLSKDMVTVSIIPHTAEETVLGSKGVGEIVNIEADMLAKYLYSFINKQEEKSTSKLSEQFLREQGF